MAINLKELVGKNALTHVLELIKGMKDGLETKIGKKADTSSIPTELPNPNALTFTGNATGTYDGSTAVTIEIPTPEGLTSATEEKLGGIKAAEKSSLDTVAVKIGEDSKLYVPTYPIVYMTSADKTKLDGFDSADTYAKKSDLTTVYRYQGSLSSDTELPVSPAVGDVYNLVSSITYGNGANVAWTGTEWDNLGATINLTGYVQKSELQEIGNDEIDNIWNTIFSS